jgi:hypothetical protein
MNPQPFLAGSGLTLLALVLGWSIPVRPSPPTQASQPIPSHASSTPTTVSFDKQVRPVLESRCQPCHFPGGSMYASLPFDRPETIHTLGEKLFTRIRDEREQALLRSFFAQKPASPSP